MPADERRTASEYDRWMKHPGPISAGMRFLMGPAGQFLVNTPAFRLPDELDIKPEDRILDIGCGSGALLRALSDRIGLTAPPVGLDISRTMLRRAVASQRQEDPLRFVLGRATALPFGDGSFDYVVCAHVIKHLADDGLLRAFEEMYRVLAPGGLALVWDFAPVSSPRLDRWNRWVVTRGVKTSHFRRYAELADAARRAGFQWTGDARLRPFIYPPIPRASIVMGKAPEGWEE